MKEKLERKNECLSKVNHRLKTMPLYYNAVCMGLKNFEVRYNDRNFTPGDTVSLDEWDPKERCLTGRSCIVEIKDIFPLDQCGEALKGYVAFTFEILELFKGE